MDDEKKWNLNAPQNDTENNRQNEPPRYEHYCMHQNTESDTVKELPEKKKNKKPCAYSCFIDSRLFFLHLPVFAVHCTP